MNHCQRKTESS